MIKAMSEGHLPRYFARDPEIAVTAAEARFTPASVNRRACGHTPPAPGQALREIRSPAALYDLVVKRAALDWLGPCLFQLAGTWISRREVPLNGDRP